MNMPRFTAGASLYRTNRHYRTGRNRQAIHLPASTIETIHPAREVIEVHNCPPGWTDYGGTCFPDPLTEPSGGGGGGPGPGTGGGGEGGVPGPGGGGTPTPHQKPPKVPSTQRPPRPQEGMACNAFIRSKKGDSYDIPDGRYSKGTSTLSDWNCCDSNRCIGCGKKGKWHTTTLPGGDWRSPVLMEI